MVDNTPTSTTTETWQQTRPLVLFYVVACAISWSIWLPLVARDAGWGLEATPQWLHAAGAIGPLLAARFVTALAAGRAGVGALVRRAFRLPARRMWMLAGLSPLLLSVTVFAVSTFVRGDTPLSLDILRSDEFPALSPLVVIAVNLVCYGFGEEVGWRAFAQPRLQARASMLGLVLIISAAWAAWHLPLFWVTGALADLRGAVIAGWVVSLVAGTALLAWLYRSSGSIVVVALFHSTMNVATTSQSSDGLSVAVVGAAVTVAGITILLRFARDAVAAREAHLVAESPRTDWRET
jgi:membrane protease YdiL (CAAX protease family)